MPGGFQTTLDPDTGSTLIYPQGDRSAEPSGRMPKDGFFFDGIVRSGPVDLDAVGPEGNMEDAALLSDAELDAIEEDVRAGNAAGDAVFASVVDTGLGDIAMVPGMKLIAPTGVREIADWYMLTAARPDVVAAIFDNVVEIGIENYRRLNARVGDMIDVIRLCGTDFGTQTSALCSVRTFDTLWRPHHARRCDWVHANTVWKTFKHSCGSVERFYESMIEAGIDIVNPVQCSAAGMDPRLLKEKCGGRLVFWGGGIATQQVLPFGTPAEVREQVLERLDIFSEGGGYVFNAIHNVQALTPVENIVAMIDAVREFNGR